MGVSGLIALLKKKAPAAFTPLSPADIRGKRVGIDLSILLCRGLATCHENGPTWYLQLLARQATWLTSLQCTAIYVLDGQHPVEKNEERQRRRETTRLRIEKANKEAEANPDDAVATDRAENIRKRQFELRHEHIIAAKRLLRGLGMSMMQAAAEAERCLSHMQRAGVIDHVFTEDIDALLCGAHSYVKDSGALPGGGSATLVSLEPALKGLECTYEGFVTLGMLAGCDFAPKLNRMGPATAHATVCKHGHRIEDCLRACGAEEVLIERYLRAKALLSYDPLFVIPEIVNEYDPMEFDRLCEELNAPELRRMVVKRAKPDFVIS